MNTFTQRISRLCLLGLLVVPAAVGADAQP